MTVAPIPNQNDQQGPQRPELRIVRDEQPPPETAAEITSPIPVLDKDGKPVQPLAPPGERIRAATLSALRHMPRLSEKPPSFAESLEYSQKGDWTTSENGLKRAAHGLCTVLAFVLTYPLDVAIRARTKPIGFVLTVAILIALINAL